MNYIHNSLNKLKRYCEIEDFKGRDPYDGLNSRIFENTPLRTFKICRLFWIQLFKLSPIDIRALFLIPKEHNPKALALFLSGYTNLYGISGDQQYKEKIDYLISKLIDIQSPSTYSGACWGYNFSWQSRTFFIPKFTPNVVVSVFTGNAFLDAYEATNNERYLEISKSICNFILKDLNRSFDDKDNFCFSYSPLDDSKIFNASLFASGFLSRIYYFTNDELLKNEAKKSIEFCCNRQNNDGSWFYGLGSNQRWIDSFHTGYNLEALYEYQKYTKDKSYKKNFEHGLDFYLSNFFTEEGIPKYYNDSIYPVDIHSTAQLIVLLSKAGLLNGNLPLAERVLIWTINNMQAETGYFYYQVKKYYKIKIPYIRWAQAWMFYALSCYLYYEKNIGT